MSQPTSHATAVNPQIPSFDLADAKTPHHRALAGIAGNIGGTALNMILSLLVPFLLNIIHLNPDVYQQYQDWDRGTADPTLNIGEVAHGFRINHVHNAGVVIQLVRHDQPKPGPNVPQPGPQPGTSASTPPAPATPPSPHANPQP
jgi:hypothetical protein